MTDQPYDIQELVTISGVPRRTVYFYVQQGILPPPQGAGLAAHYTKEHLLRLRLIPVLRQQGLRLDEIRRRFEQASAEELEQMLHIPAQPVPAKTTPPPPPASIHQPPAPYTPNLAGQRITQYNLPGGISLLIPDSLNPLDRQRAELLLGAARQIFYGSPYHRADASLATGAQASDEPTHSPEEE